MKKIKTLKYLLFLSVIMVNFNSVYGQNSHIILNEDPKLTKVIEIKKELNKDNIDQNKYKIQIFSGALTDAENEQSKFNETFNDWPCQLVYETPNYKVWVGNYRTRLQADRALLEIQKHFLTAFIFKPKKRETID